jgi:hypothetical protein
MVHVDAEQSRRLSVVSRNLLHGEVNSVPLCCVHGIVIGMMKASIGAPMITSGRPRHHSAL